MAVFTKTYVQCDLCEQSRELPVTGEGWYRIEANITRLGAGNSPSDKLTLRVSDICQSCFAAVQEGEFSSLFFVERPKAAKLAPVS